MPEEMGQLIMQIVPLLGILVLFYFMLIRPQQKKDKAVKKMRSEIKVGDNVTTIGGIFGTVSKIKDDVITLDVGQDKTKLIVARWAISGVTDDSSIEGDTLQP